MKKNIIGSVLAVGVLVLSLTVLPQTASASVFSDFFRWLIPLRVQQTTVPTGEPSRGSIKITNPKGDSYSPGRTVPITWTSGGITGNVAVDVMTPDKKTVLVSTSLVGNPGQYDFTIPSDTATGPYIIRVRSENVTANAEFRVDPATPRSSSEKPTITVLSPNGGETFKIGSQQVVRWNAPSSVPTVRIFLESVSTHYAGGGVNGYIPDIHKILAYDVANSGSFTASITDVPEGKYKVLIEGIDSSKKTVLSDSSDNYFNIVSNSSVETNSSAPQITSVSSKAIGNPAINTCSTVVIQGSHLSGDVVNTKVYVGGKLSPVIQIADNLIYALASCSLTSGQSYDAYVVNNLGTSNTVKVTVLSVVTEQPTITVDVKNNIQYGVGNSSAFVTTSIGAGSQNSMVVTWGLNISCPTGVTLIVPSKTDSTGQNFCGTTQKYYSNNYASINQGIIVLTAGAVNSNNSQSNIGYALTAYDGNGKVIGSDKDVVTLNASGSNSQTISASTLNTLCQGTPSSTAASVVWAARPSGGNGDYKYAWYITGDLKSYTGGSTASSVVTASYQSPGTKQASLSVSDGANTVTTACQATINPNVSLTTSPTYSTQSATSTTPAPNPQITTVYPPSGPIGSFVTLFGKNFYTDKDNVIQFTVANNGQGSSGTLYIKARSQDGTTLKIAIPTQYKISGAASFYHNDDFTSTKVIPFTITPTATTTGAVSQNVGHNLLSSVFYAIGDILNGN